MSEAEVPQPENTEEKPETIPTVDAMFEKHCGLVQTGIGKMEAAVRGIVTVTPRLSAVGKAEVSANLTMAIRALEDAQFRLFLAIQRANYKPEAEEGVVDCGRAA